MKSMKSSTFKLLAALFATVLIIVLVFVGMKVVENIAVRKADADIDASHTSVNIDNSIFIDGTAYVPREGVHTVLLIGLDTTGKMRSSNQELNQNMSDFFALLVFDDQRKDCTVLMINRDTMTEVPRLNETGERDGSFYGQLAYAFVFGDGMSRSGHNAERAVSNLLYNIEIDNYIAVNMDAVSMLNDLVGGVTVEIKDDFGDYDPTLVQGQTVKLLGKHALNFVRGRMSVGDGKNTSRMERQRVYLEGLGEALRTTYDKRGDNFIVKAYSSISDYMVTDCSLHTLSDMAQKLSDYKLSEIQTLKGRNDDSGEYMEFYPDQAALKELVKELFYVPAKEQDGVLSPM